MVYSQNSEQQAPDKVVKEAAVEKALFLKVQLGLTSQQTALLQEKILDIAIRKNRLQQSKMREEAKVERLENLQKLENEAIQEILTEPQYKNYLLLLQNKRKRDGCQQ